jgi:hypothetical protein
MIIVRTWVINQAGRLTFKKFISSDIFCPFKTHDNTRHFCVYLYQFLLLFSLHIETNVKSCFLIAMVFLRFCLFAPI